ncbi:MAG: M23 family metallopeptidase [Beijerinckiaceae bacterium]|nr:M23 family metallopeptidase [Beijerinckiaceae bacterium]
MPRIQDQAPPFARKRASEARCNQPRVTLRRGTFAAMVGALVALSSGAVGSLGYVLWRDEALLALSSRHASIERSYEEHVSSLRRELEKVNSQRVIQEAALETRVRELWNRQAQIEKRATILSTIAGAGSAPEQTTRAARSAPRAASTPLPVPTPVLGFAPTMKGPISSALDALDKASPKPFFQPEQMDAVPSRRAPERPALRGALAPLGPDTTPTGNLASLITSLDRLESVQIGLASAVGEHAKREARRLETLATQIGLSATLLARASARSAEGGPFIPMRLDPNNSPFDRELLRHHDDVVRADRLRRILATAPLGRPVSSSAEQSSAFGSRIDPFLGRAAYHTGIDFRDRPGAPVFATAPGKVLAAGSNGGYGLMVEIDHGNGITTRYAHLSAIIVEEGQSVPAKKVIGRVGSTGRSTGPHLHYEVRIDDDAVDPTRFLRAGAQLASANEAGAH